MAYWIVDEFRKDGKLVKTQDGPFNDSQKRMVMREANKSDKYFSKNNPMHVRSYVIWDNGKEKEYIYPDNLLKRALKSEKPRLANKIKLPKIKNSWLVKRSRGRC